MVGGRPITRDVEGYAEENEGRLRADDAGLAGEVILIQAGAVDGEVGDTRRMDEPEGHLDGLAIPRLGLDGG